MRCYRYENELDGLYLVIHLYNLPLAFIIDSIMVFNFDASICFEDSGYSTTGYPTPVYPGTPTTTSSKPTGTRTVTYYQ